MSREIIASTKSRFCCDIFNGIKKTELRKDFPTNYRGWVNVYCTRAKPYLDKLNTGEFILETEINEDNYKRLNNGKVIGRFRVDRVDVYANGCLFENENNTGYFDDYLINNVCERACVSEDELLAWAEDLSFCAIQIGRVEIFDKPKKLSDFSVYKVDGFKPLDKAPQSWQYVATNE